MGVRGAVGLTRRADGDIRGRARAVAIATMNVPPPPILTPVMYTRRQSMR